MPRWSCSDRERPNRRSRTYHAPAIVAGMGLLANRSAKPDRPAVVSKKCHLNLSAGKSFRFHCHRAFSLLAPDFLDSHIPQGYEGVRPT